MAAEPSQRVFAPLATVMVALGMSLFLTSPSWAFGPAPQALNDDGYTSVFTKSSYNDMVQGSALADAGHCDQAIPFFKKTIERRPTDVLAWYSLAVCSSNRADETTDTALKAELNQQAEIAYGRVKDLNPNIDVTYYKLGKYAMERGEYKAAKALYMEGVFANPDNVILLFNLAVASEKLDDVFGAQQAYEDAIKANPQFVYAYNNLGLLYEQQNQLDKAEATYKAALERVPEYNFARLNLGNLLQSEDRLDEAEKVYSEVVRYEPDNMWGYLYLGNVHYKQSNYESALHAYDHVISLNPNYTPAYFLSSLALQKLNRGDEALDRGMQYIRLEPNGAFSKEASDLVYSIKTSKTRALGTP